MSGVPQMAYWSKFFIAIYGNIAYIQTKLVFQLRPSQQWLFKLHASFFDNTVELLDELLCALNCVW